jgi:hypothetical protein
MIAALLALALVMPASLDLPPEVPIDVAATVSVPAVRLDPPPPTTEATPAPSAGSSASAGGRCVGWEPLLAEYSPGWSVERMSRIMYRESRCRPEVRNRSGATGLLQVMASHCRWLVEQMGEWCTAGKLQDPDYNVRAAATLWLEQGYQAWAL